MMIDSANDAQSIRSYPPTQIAWANRLIIDGPIYFLSHKDLRAACKLYIYGTVLPFRIETSLIAGRSMDA
jgi:hypothetical protein